MQSLPHCVDAVGKGTNSSCAQFRQSHKEEGEVGRGGGEQNLVSDWPF